MTIENAQYHTFAVNMRAITGLGVVQAGSLPDQAHLSSGGYHVGVEDIQRVGRWDTDYSTRQPRDRLDGTNDSSAFDIGDNWPRGGRAAWLRWNNMLLSGLINRDPALTAVRAINVSRDGVERKRYDTLHREDGLINSTDGVTFHTHGETWRDQRGRAALDRAFRRIEQMADAAVRNIPLPPEGSLIMALSEQQQHDLWEWLALLVDPGTPVGGRASDRFHFPPPLKALAARLDALAASAAADEQRDQAALAAIQALAAQIQAGGGSIDAAPIIAAVRAVGDQVHADVVQLQQQLAESRQREQAALAELAAVRAAAEAQLSPAERAALPSAD